MRRSDRRKTDEAGAGQGLRARTKAERQTRLLTAARVLFTEKGYEDATLNQIAAIAGLGKGTIFGYVTDKRDLIFLIFYEEMSVLVERSFVEMQTRVGLLDKIMSIAELHYQLYAKNPRLARILVNETNYRTDGLHMEKFTQLRLRLIKGIECQVVAAKKSGDVRSKEAASFIARQIFFCFATEVREWLTPSDPEVPAGLRQFRRSLKLLLYGVTGTRAGG